jgi:hypothetical protein
VDIEVDVRGSGKQARRVVRIRQRCYPDGEPWTEQEAIVTEAFNVMTSEVRKVVRRG